MKVIKKLQLILLLILCLKLCCRMKPTSETNNDKSLSYINLSAYSKLNIIKVGYRIHTEIKNQKKYGSYFDVASEMNKKKKVNFEEDLKEHGAIFLQLEGDYCFKVDLRKAEKSEPRIFLFFQERKLSDCFKYAEIKSLPENSLITFGDFLENFHRRYAFGKKELSDPKEKEGKLKGRNSAIIQHFSYHYMLTCLKGKEYIEMNLYLDDKSNCMKFLYEVGVFIDDKLSRSDIQKQNFSKSILNYIESSAQNVINESKTKH